MKLSRILEIVFIMVLAASLTSCKFGDDLARLAVVLAGAGQSQPTQQVGTYPTQQPRPTVQPGQIIQIETPIVRNWTDWGIAPVADSEESPALGLCHSKVNSGAYDFCVLFTREGPMVRSYVSAPEQNTIQGSFNLGSGVSVQKGSEVATDLQLPTALKGCIFIWSNNDQTKKVFACH